MRGREREGGRAAAPGTGGIRMHLSDRRLIVIAGHYGSGKTNLAVNYALRLAESGRSVTLADLDIVNPYFRAADAADVLRAAGAELIAPVYANTNLDIPALPPSIQGVFADRTRTAVFDVGGDDAGAVALGQYSRFFAEEPYEFYYVINGRRLLTETPEDCAALLAEIENASRLRATGIINNTNLGCETTPQLVRDSAGFAAETARLTGLPLICTAAARPVAAELAGEDIFPLDLYTRTYW